MLAWGEGWTVGPVLWELHTGVPDLDMLGTQCLAQNLQDAAARLCSLR